MKTDFPEQIDLDRADAIRWARRSLGIVDANAVIDTAAVLNVVTKHGYVLPPDSVDAAIVAANANQVDKTLGVHHGREQRLTDQVQQFATSFFDCEPNERAQTWQVLSADCETFPALRRWLEELRPGISLVELPSPATETSRELVVGCCRAFTSRQPERIRRQQEFIALCRERPEFWGPVVHEFLKHNSQFGKLVAPWLNQILQTANEQKSDHVSFVTATQRVGQTHDHVSVVSATPRSHQQPVREGNGSGFSYWWLLIVISAIGRLGLNSTPSHQNPSPSMISMNRPGFSSPRMALPRKSTVDPTGTSSLHDFEDFVPHEFSFKNFPQETINDLLIDMPELRPWLNDTDKRERLEELVKARFPELARAIVVHCRLRKDRMQYSHGGFLGHGRETLERFKVFLRSLDTLEKARSAEQPASALNPANGSDIP